MPTKNWSLYILVPGLFLILLLFALIFRNILKVETEKQTMVQKSFSEIKRYQGMITEAFDS